MSKEHRQRFALGHKKGKNSQKTYQSRANHTHCSFLKSDKSNSLFCKERRELIAHGRSVKRAILSERPKEQIPKGLARVLQQLTMYISIQNYSCNITYTP